MDDLEAVFRNIERWFFLIGFFYYCHTGKAITYIDELVVISLPQVMEHRGIVKVCQVRHILSFFVFRRVHLLELIFLEVFRLVVCHLNSS